MTGLPEVWQDVIEATPRARAAARADELILPPQEDMQSLARRAAAACGTPWGVLTVLTAREQVVKAAYGQGPDYLQDRVPLEWSICSYVVAADKALIARDTYLAPHIRACLALPHVRSYAGVPFHLDAIPVGALAGLGPVPQDFKPGHLPALRALAAEASAAIARLAV